MKFSFLYLVLMVSFFFTSSFSAFSQTTKKDKNEKTLNGIRYKKQLKGKGKALTDSSIVQIAMKIYTSNTSKDSLLRSTYEEEYPLLLDLRDSNNRQMPIVKILTENGKIGDSLTLFIHSDSLFQNGQIRPIFIPQGSFLRHEIKLLKHFNTQEFEAEQQAMQQKYMEEIMKQQQQAEQEAQLKVKDQLDYLENTYFPQEGITNFQKTATGLYYVVEKQGTPIVNGEKVKVHYEGKLINGQKFDSSFDRGEPIEFPIGVGQVIQGWDEGIPLIGKGGKGFLYIPSNLGYGERGAGGQIPANSTLIFRVEVIE